MVSGEVTDDGSDLVVAARVGVDGTGFAGTDAVGEGLHRADAVKAKRGQQAVGNVLSELTDSVFSILEVGGGGFAAQPADQETVQEDMKGRVSSAARY